MLNAPDGVKEGLEALTEALKQRIGSPILFSIAITEILYNYKFILTIFF